MQINLTGSLWGFSISGYLGQEERGLFIGDMEGYVKFIIQLF